MQRTLILVKPDGVRRGLIGAILSRFEARGLRLVAMRLLQADEALARRLYSVHEGKAFYESLVAFITSGPIVAAVLEGERAIEAVRQTMGATDPLKASPGSIRGDFGLDIQSNLVHGSDSEESAAREIPIFFSQVDFVS